MPSRVQIFTAHELRRRSLPTRPRPRPSRPRAGSRVEQAVGHRRFDESLGARRARSCGRRRSLRARRCAGSRSAVAKPTISTATRPTSMNWPTCRRPRTGRRRRRSSSMATVRRDRRDRHRIHATVTGDRIERNVPARSHPLYDDGRRTIGLDQDGWVERDETLTARGPRGDRRRWLRRHDRGEGARAAAGRDHPRRPPQLPHLLAVAVPGRDRRVSRPTTSHRTCEASCSATANVDAVMAEVRGVDFDRPRRCSSRTAAAIPYDVLVLAAGAVSSDFGVPGVREHAIALKTLDDAIARAQRGAPPLRRGQHRSRR